ncbi:relaxase domain-containing protein [Candidatus Poribacteria bacterium]|nr:relaxase domain-containing protein [Acidimicrobiia bacterium]MYK97145.1 relaxase domain-containing protein [Candidatus Poribacteria bacterium]
MLSIAKVGPGHAEYYTSGGAAGVHFSSQVDQAGYYTDSGEQPGVWAAAGAMGVQVGGAVTIDQLKAMLAGCDPDTGEQLGRRINPGGTFIDRLGIARQRKAVGGFDLTYSVPKSVSTAWALADEATRREIESAWSLSVRSLIDYVQANGVASRSGTGGANNEEVPNGATIARFDHYTSRSGDPQLHSHLVVANKVRCGDGKWRTLDGRALYATAKAASMVGGAVLRAELSRRLGWSWDRIDERLHAEVAGSPQHLIETWSSRSRDTAREAGRRVRQFEADTGREPTVQERIEIWNQAAVATRQSKKLLSLDGDPHDRWRAEAIQLGLDPAKTVAGYRSARRIERDAYDRPEFVVDGPQLALDGDMMDLLLAAAEDSATSLSDVDLDAVVYAAVNAGPGCEMIVRSGDEIAAVTATALRDRLEQRLVRHEGRWSSPGLIAAEQATAAWLASPVPVDASAIERIDLTGLGDDQAQAAKGLIATRSAGSILIGPAGSGKTTALACIAAAVGGDRIVATAPTAVAAGTLGAALGTASSTVALINTSGEPIPQGGWVIVDEAGQLSTRDLAALCGKAAAADARVVLVGDPAQQGSVSAGGMFDALAACDVLPAFTLSQLWRFDDPAEAKATSAIHRGLKQGLDYHRDRHRITDGSGADAAAAAADWWKHHRHHTTVICAPTLELAQQINAEIADRRSQAGETGEAVAGTGDLTIRVGDIVTTRRNDRHRRANDGLPVRNGDRWTVAAATEQGDLILSHLDRQAEATVTAAYAARHVDLGYAITQTRAQSTTVDASLTVITGSTGRDQLYVGLSRGRSENWLHIITDTPAADPESAPTHTVPDKVIDAVFARRHGWATATDVTAPAMALSDAKTHLESVAARSSRSLPASDSLDAVALVAGSDIVAQRARADYIDHHIADEIDDWLAGLHETEGHSAALEDRELMEAEVRLLEHIDRLDSTRLHPAEPSQPAESQRRPTLGAIRKARGLLDNDFRFIDSQALERIRQNNQRAAESGRHDNPWLVQLWSLYQRADAHGRHRLVPVIAAISDTPARQRIEALGDCQPPTGQIAAWTADVRAAVAARRVLRHRNVLEDLAAQRTARIAQACGADQSHLLEADARRWEAAIDDWIDSGCTTRHLSTAWEQAAFDIASDLFDADNDSTAPDPGGCMTGPRPPHHNPDETTRREPPTAISIPVIAALANRPAPEPALSSAPADVRSEPNATAVESAASWYHHLLINSPEAAEARDYLLGRGISEDLWEKWRLGWAPDQWQGLTSHLARIGISEQAGINAGVLGETNGRVWDFLRGRVVFPIQSIEGTTIALAGRTLSDGPKYINTRATRLYDKSEALYGIEFAADAIAHSGEAVIVEGYTDAIAAHAAGIDNAVAACGTALGSGHLGALETKCGAPGLLTLVLDSDTAGTTAAQSIAQLASRHPLHTRAVHLPPGTDPASLAPGQLRDAITHTLPHPWAAIAHITALDRSRAYSQLAKAARAAVKQSAGDPIATVLAAHEIAVAADLDLQLLIDEALVGPEQIASPARTAGIGL